MAITTKSNVLIPELVTETVRGAFAQKTAFMGSSLVSAGLVVVNPYFDVSDPSKIGETTRVPYFGTLGEFEDLADGQAAVPKALAAMSETATIGRAVLAFESTKWANSTGGHDVTPEQEAAAQVVRAATRYADKKVIASAVAGGIIKDVYNSTTPQLLDYDLVVDAATLWGDESDPAAALLVHSKVKADCLKLKDATGRPLLTTTEDGKVSRLAGKQIIESDSLPLTGSSMGAVTATGTSPPTVSLAGEPLGPWDFKIDCVTGGSSNGTATFRFSTDGGSKWSGTYTIPSGGGAIALDDSFTATATPITGNKSVDSLVGNNGLTGITATFANGTYNADNLYSAKATLKATSLLVRPGSLVFWYNRMGLELLTDRDILKHSGVGAMHMYSVGHCYRRHPQGVRSGCIAIRHNVSPIR